MDAEFAGWTGLICTDDLECRYRKSYVHLQFPFRNIQATFLQYSPVMKFLELQAL